MNHSQFSGGNRTTWWIFGIATYSFAFLAGCGESRSIAFYEEHHAEREAVLNVMECNDPVPNLAIIGDYFAARRAQENIDQESHGLEIKTEHDHPDLVQSGLALSTHSGERNAEPVQWYGFCGRFG